MPKTYTYLNSNDKVPLIEFFDIMSFQKRMGWIKDEKHPSKKSRFPVSKSLGVVFHVRVI